MCRTNVLTNLFWAHNNKLPALWTLNFYQSPLSFQHATEALWHPTVSHRCKTGTLWWQAGGCSLKLVQNQSWNFEWPFNHNINCVVRETFWQEGFRSWTHKRVPFVVIQCFKLSNFVASLSNFSAYPGNIFCKQQLGANIIINIYLNKHFLLTFENTQWTQFPLKWYKSSSLCHT